MPSRPSRPRTRPPLWMRSSSPPQSASPRCRTRRSAFRRSPARICWLAASPPWLSLAQGTPGVSLKSEGPSQTEIEMRGMTSSGGNSATVGFYLDDIPLAGPASAQNGHVVIDPDLYDLNRIEILRGPQGTLFGSGSMGGTVRLITNQPNLSQFQSTRTERLIGHRRRRVQPQRQLDGQPPAHRRHLGTTDRGNRGLYERLDRPHRGRPFSAGRWKPGRHACAAMSRTPPSRSNIRARMPIKSMRRA